METFRRNARTFSLAARLLPRRLRLPVATLYWYCRAVDEIADRRPPLDPRRESFFPTARLTEGDLHHAQLASLELRTLG